MGRGDSGGTRRIPGFCALCRSRCGCLSVVEEGRLVAVEPDPSHPTGRHLCAKGRAAPELVHHPERLRRPLQRTRPKGDPDPGWREIGWDEALDLTAEQLRRIAAESGPEAVAFAVTTPSGTAMSDHIGWVERLVRAFGSPNTVYATEICNWHKDHAHAFTFGAGIGSPDFARAGCVLLWGYNPSATWLAHATAVAEAKARGAGLLVVDPRRVGLANKADLWLQVRPGSDGALALAVAGVMIEEGWFDRDFIRDWSNGPFLVRDDDGRLLRDGEGLLVWDEAAKCARAAEEAARPALDGSLVVATQAGPVACRPAFALYAELARAMTPERAEAITGVPAAGIRAAARLLWQSRPVSLYAWNGLGQHDNATQTDRALALLYALTGSRDAPGGNLTLAAVPTNDVSGRDLVTAETRARTLGLAARPLGPGREGWITSHDLYTAVLDETPYAVRGLVGFGSNLLVSQPGATRARAALQRLDWHVQLDLFMTPTAALADLVLPVTTPWEHEALRFGFGLDQDADSLVQLRPAAVKPQGESRSDSEIVFDLARRLGLGARFFGGDLEAGLAHQLAPSGLTLEALRAHPKGLHVPLETEYRKYRTRGFATPSGRVEIYSEQLLDQGQAPLPVYREPAVGPLSRPDLAARFPLVLTSAKSPLYCHSQHRALPSLRARQPQPIAELHPETARARGIADGDWIAITSPAGAARARARLTRTIAPGVVCAQHGWWQGCAALGLEGTGAEGEGSCNSNLLFAGDAGDPISGSLPLRSFLCQVAPVFGGETTAI